MTYALAYRDGQVFNRSIHSGNALFKSDCGLPSIYVTFFIKLIDANLQAANLYKIKQYGQPLKQLVKLSKWQAYVCITKQSTHQPVVTTG